jgi:hypothetical protein
MEVSAIPVTTLVLGETLFESGTILQDIVRLAYDY